MQESVTAVTTNGLIALEFTIETVRRAGAYSRDLSEIALSSALLQRERVEDHPNILKGESAPQCEQIAVDPKVLNGEPHIRGTRIPLSVIINGWAEGLMPEELIEHYPRLTLDDIRAALEYAASMTLLQEE